MLPRQTLEHFDDFLEARGLRLDAIIVGGSALVLIGIIDRPTRDVDVLSPDLAPSITDASRAFALEMRSRGIDRSDTAERGLDTLEHPGHETFDEPFIARLRQAGEQ